MGWVVVVVGGLWFLLLATWVVVVTLGVVWVLVSWLHGGFLGYCWVMILGGGEGWRGGGCCFGLGVGSCCLLLGMVGFVVDGSFRLVVRCLPLVGHWLVVVCSCALVVLSSLLVAGVVFFFHIVGVFLSFTCCCVSMVFLSMFICN